MQNNKGWDFLTTFADINDNYIYQASKPWKENKIKTFKMPLKKVIACAVIVMIAVGFMKDAKKYVESLEESAKGKSEK